MDGARRWAAAAAATALALPAVPSVVILLTVQPLAAWMPPVVVEALRPLAARVLAAVADLPPESLAGQLFYGSFAPLPALFGSAALAAHAALLGAPWVALAALAGRRIARAPGRSRREKPSVASPRGRPPSLTG